MTEREVKEGRHSTSSCVCKSKDVFLAVPRHQLVDFLQVFHSSVYGYAAVMCDDKRAHRRKKGWDIIVEKSRQDF